MRRTRFIVVQAALALALTTCQGEGENELPPLFNAVDPSMQCEAGRIGWDFSTGGASEEQSIVDPRLSNEITIVDATFGANVNATPGNWTEKLAAICNGRTECSMMLGLSGDGDPVPGHHKDFRAQYRCGTESAVNEVFIPPDAYGKTVTVRCGEKLTVTRASYGTNCNPALEGNFTDRITALCPPGVRRCTPGITNDALFGKDPHPGCWKDTVITYLCGASTEPRTVTSRQNSYLSFDCPPRPTTAAESLKLQVIRADFGKNCGAPSGNWTSRMQASCNGKASCTRKVVETGDPDPKPGCGKDLAVVYKCGNDPNYSTLNVAADAFWSTVTLRCGEQMVVTRADYGYGCPRPTVNILARAKAQCDGTRRCSFSEKGTQLFGSDPCKGTDRVTWATFNYFCASGTTERSATFSESDVVDFSCDPEPTQATFASGIRIDEATWGANCTTPTSLRNNHFQAAAAACYGRDSCSFVVTGKDPAGGCPKAFDLTYHCGEETEQQTVHLDGEAYNKTVSLSCAPAVRVLSATYGKNCNRAEGNATRIVAEACKGARGQCLYQANQLGDPAPGCAKQLDVQYACGVDPTVKTASIPGEAAGKTVTLACPTPTTPYSRKACIPTACRGRQRRSADLECVADLTKPVLPPFDGKVTLVEDGNYLFSDTPYSFKVAIPFKTDLPADLPYGPQITDATLWAHDTFMAAAPPYPLIQGFRCLIGKVGLHRPQPNDPLLIAIPNIANKRSRVLVGELRDVVLAPGCFGTNMLSFRDTAKRLYLPESVFRQYFVNLESTRIALSFDPEGRTIALRTPGVTADQAPQPNPIGFFYDPNRLWVNFLDYYRQTRIPEDQITYVGPSSMFSFFSPTAGVNMWESTNLRVAANSAQIRNPEQSLSLYDSQPPRFLEVDFTWSMTGDAPGANPFSPTKAPLSSNVRTLAQRGLSATVEITPTSEYYLRRLSNGWVASAQSMTLGTARQTLLEKGTPTGQTVRINAELTEAVRQRVFRLANDNNGWLPTADTTNSTFMVRVCIDIDERDRSQGNDNDTTPFTAWRGQKEYSAGFAPYRRCVVSNQVVALTRWFEKMPFAFAQSSLSGSAGRPMHQGNSSVSSNGSSGSQVECDRACTVDADCGGGDTCTGNANGKVGACTGAGRDTRCRNTDNSSLNSGGALSMSLYSTTTVSSNRSTQTGTKSHVSSVSKAMDFTVLDGGEDDEGEANWQVGHPGTQWSLSFSPNWDVIINLLRGETLAEQASPLQVLFSKQKLSLQMQGLGVGVGREYLFYLGPIFPVTLSLSAGVGFGVAVNLSMAANAEPNYPCLGGTGPCFRYYATPSTLTEANDSCLSAGGRLAELRTATEREGVKAAIGNNSGEAWVGNQLSYKYPYARCATNADGDCKNRSRTVYRWMRTGAPLVEQAGLNTTLVNQDASVLTATQLSTLTTKVPDMAGVAFDKGADRFRSHLLKDKLAYVCQFSPATAGASSKIAVGLGLGAAAGVNASMCFPGSNLGLCLSLSLSLSLIGRHHGNRNAQNG